MTLIEQPAPEPAAPAPTPACGNCSYFQPLIDAGMGQCLRYPPQMLGTGNARGAFPQISTADWCGEYSNK